MNLRFSKNQVYSTKYFFYRYNDTFSKLVKIKACRNSGFETEFFKKTEKQEVERISLSRTKKNIFELALCNNFEYFITFTVNSNVCDRFSLIDTQKVLKTFLKSYKRKCSNFAYLIITERHKDGAYHFHGLAKNFLNNDLYVNQNGFISSKHFDGIGFNSFQKIKDYNKCCRYITKYISKDCVRNNKNQIYISSRGLKKADRNEVCIDNDGSIVWDFINDFCCIKNIKGE